MRRKREIQLPLSGLWPNYRLAQELRAVSKILDDNPSILDLVLHDLCDNANSGQGAPGLSTEQVLQGETVPANEKVLSLFEEHTDIIKKKRRETVFGHKLFLTAGGSGLMLDAEVVRGNPNDAAQFQPWLKRQHDLYGRWPRQVSCDGCFASRPNLDWAKKQGIQDVAFAKKRGLKVPEMARSR